MKSQRTPHQLANEIRLLRTQHSGSFLLVEGPDDGRLYRRFIDQQKCHLVVGFNKTNVVSAVGLLDTANCPGVLGLVDSDFDVLDGTTAPSPNIVSGDTHDLETTLIRSPALETVLEEFASPEKLRAFEGRYGGTLRDWLIASARPLGYLRWHSLKNGLGFRFEGLHFSRFVNIHNLNLNPSALCSQIKNQSQLHALSNEDLLAAGWPSERKDDPWQICCGHDLVELLALSLRRCVGSKTLTTDEVSRSLRLAFSAQHFALTALYTAIKQWQHNTTFAIL
jgi:Protein of unknown function (DUF4435)